MRRRITYVIVAGFLFVGTSALVARSLAATSAERGSIIKLLQGQANGRADAVLALLPDCSREPHCVRMTRERVRRLQRPGQRLQVLNFVPSARLAMTTQTRSARVAWRTGDGPAVVQCIRVLREGPLSGGKVRLIAVSDPIGGEASCSAKPVALAKS